MQQSKPTSAQAGRSSPKKRLRFKPQAINPRPVIEDHRVDAGLAEDEGVPSTETLQHLRPGAGHQPDQRPGTGLVDGVLVHQDVAPCSDPRL